MLTTSKSPVSTNMMGMPGSESVDVDNLWTLSRHDVRLFGSTKTTKPLHFCRGFVLYGAGTRSRTRDLLITSQLLYQLSYTGVLGRRL